MRTARRSSCLLGGVCLSACWDTPPGVGLETSHNQTPQPPPWVWDWRPPLGQNPPPTSPGFGHGDPPVNRITDTCKNITLPQQECIPVGCVPSAAVAAAVPGWCVCVPACKGVDTPPSVDKILDTRLWKHYLSATTVVDGNDLLPSYF